MAVFKFLGSWVLAAAGLALVNDVMRALAPGVRLTFLSMRGLWLTVSEASYQAAQAAVQKVVHPLAWDPVALLFLKLPAWFILAAVGVLLCYIGRRRRRVELYTN